MNELINKMGGRRSDVNRSVQSDWTYQAARFESATLHFSIRGMSSNHSTNLFIVFFYDEV